MSKNVILEGSRRQWSATLSLRPCAVPESDFFRLGHHTDYIDEHALPDRMVSFAGAVGHLFILCHPQRLKIMRRVFIIFGTVRAHTAVVT